MDYFGFGLEHIGEEFVVNFAAYGQGESTYDDHRARRRRRHRAGCV